MKAQKTLVQSSDLTPTLKDFSWPFWAVVPIYPYGQRQTLCKEVLANTIWTFEQLQGILQVVVPIRMTVIRLSTGGLFVYAPVAPTPQCIKYLLELTKLYGDVKYIILPTISGVEHKVFVGPFARYFSEAQVFVIPNQWSFPVNLPLSWLGFPPKRTQFLPQDSSQTPFADEFDYAILAPISLNIGSFSEVVFFHKASKTLLVNDLLISIPEDPPEIIQSVPDCLLFHAKDDVFDQVLDSPASRRKGWQRICLLSLYFQPQSLEVTGIKQTLQESFQASDRSSKAYFGLYPFKWHWSWQESFDKLRDNGKLLVAPILQELILNRDPQGVINWVETVASWDIERMIASHFDSPISTTSQELRQAFSFLTPEKFQQNNLIPQEEIKVLKRINNILVKTKIIPPPCKSI